MWVTNSAPLQICKEVLFEGRGPGATVLSSYGYLSVPAMLRVQVYAHYGYLSVPTMLQVQAYAYSTVESLEIYWLKCKQCSLLARDFSSCRQDQSSHSELCPEFKLHHLSNEWLAEFKEQQYSTRPTPQSRSTRQILEDRRHIRSQSKAASTAVSPPSSPEIKSTAAHASPVQELQQVIREELGTQDLPTQQEFNQHNTAPANLKATLEFLKSQKEQAEQLKKAGAPERKQQPPWLEPSQSGNIMPIAEPPEQKPNSQESHNQSTDQQNNVTLTQQQLEDLIGQAVSAAINKRQAPA